MNDARLVVNPGLIKPVLSGLPEVLMKPGLPEVGRSETGKHHLPAQSYINTDPHGSGAG
jgi:hypothetical protein